MGYKGNGVYTHKGYTIRSEYGRVRVYDPNNTLMDAWGADSISKAKKQIESQISLEEYNANVKKMQEEGPKSVEVKFDDKVQLEQTLAALYMSKISFANAHPSDAELVNSLMQRLIDQLKTAV